MLPCVVWDTHVAGTSLGWYKLREKVKPSSIRLSPTLRKSYRIKSSVGNLSGLLFAAFLLCLELVSNCVCFRRFLQCNHPNAPKAVSFRQIMNEFICMKVLSLCPSVLAWRTLMRVYWSHLSRATLIYLCLKAAAVRSLWNCWPHRGFSPSGPCQVFFFFSSLLTLQTHWNSSKALHSLPRGLLVNPCKLQMFSQAARGEETSSSPCKHLSDKSLRHRGDNRSLEGVK